MDSLESDELLVCFSDCKKLSFQKDVNGNRDCLSKIAFGESDPGETKQGLEDSLGDGRSLCLCDLAGAMILGYKKSRS